MVNSPKSGQQIRRERESRGISQQELAEKLGVSTSIVSKWERDKAAPSKRNLEAFKRAMSHPESDSLDAEDMKTRILIRHRNRALEGLEILCELALSGSKPAEDHLQKLGKEISDVLAKLPPQDGR